jgi:hypothetical protein
VGERVERYLQRLFLVSEIKIIRNLLTCRVMCHASNTLWELRDVDERLVEKPVAPGGATGGVEYEAMAYVVSPT